MNNKTINQEAHLLYALFQKIPIAMRLSLFYVPSCISNACRKHSFSRY